MYSSAFDSLVCYLLPRSDCMWSATLTSLQEKLWDSMFNWGKSAYFLHILQSFSFLSGWYLRRNLIINTGTCVTSELTKLIAKLTEESLWLSSRASDNGIRRSEVQFLTGFTLSYVRVVSCLTSLTYDTTRFQRDTGVKCLLTELLSCKSQNLDWNCGRG